MKIALMVNGTGNTRKLWTGLAAFVLLMVSGANGQDVQDPEPLPKPQAQRGAQPQSPQLQRPDQKEQPQQTPPAGQPKISLEVKTVSVLATVRDKHGRIVPNLTKNDFQIQEDGRPQIINYFAKEGDLPLRLGLLVDTSLSQRRVIEQERTASYSFLDHLLREDKDLAFVIQFAREVELLQDFTPSRPKLQAALQSLETPEADSGGGGRSRGGNGGSSPNGGWGGGGTSGASGSHSHGGGTLLYDAIYLAANELMVKQHGRKALIILSDGVDHGSKETLTEAIRTAQQADTVVYSILFKDDEGYSHPAYGMGHGGHHGGMGGGRPPAQEERPDGKKILQQISKETGGRLFEVSKKETVEKIYGDIEEELRNQYSLGYSPDKNTGAGYHRILVTTKDGDLKVQARDGYYTGGE